MATMQVVYRFVQSDAHTPPLSRNTPYLLDGCHGNYGSHANCVQIIVQSDAHIHHHCQETYNNNKYYRCLIVVVMATIVVDYT